MIKLVIFLGLFISFGTSLSSVNSNNEQSLGNVSQSNLPPSEEQKLGEDKKNKENAKILHSIDIDDTIEEKLITNLCKVDLFDVLNNNEESDASNKKDDTKLETTSIENKNSTKTSPEKHFESINEDNKDQTINTTGNKRAAIGLINTLPTRRIVPGILEKPSNQDLKDYKLYQKQTLHDEDNIWNSRRNLFPNIDEISNSYDTEKVKKRNVNEAAAQEVIEDDLSESKFMEPTIGKGIFDMKNTKVMLMENAIVCYACSTMSNPRCWSPDKRTTVKYCRKGHQSCLTKTFQHKGTSLIIRDCGMNCENQSGNEKYSTCTVCHSDLCNGASAIIANTGVAMIILLGLLYSRH